MQQAASEKKYSRLIGQIDIEINKSGSSDDKAQLYCNRGLCHQRLNLNRKALKVKAACTSGTPALAVQSLGRYDMLACRTMTRRSHTGQGTSWLIYARALCCSL